MAYFRLWDQISGEWRITPQYPTVEGGLVIDAQWYANAGNWDDLSAWGIYEELLSTEPAPLGYLEPEVNLVDGRERALRYAAGTAEERIAATREQKAREIDAQVPDGGARQLVEDPLFEGLIQSNSGGASERKSELEDTPDAEVAAFNTAIVPTPFDGAGYVQAKMTTFIDIVDPWAGAPDAIYALRVALRIITPGSEADGESARAHMFNGDGVDQGVLPFTQDPDDPAVWQCQSQDGRFWTDPEDVAKMRLYWDSGSLPVTDTMTIEGYGDASRKYAIVRAGLPGARRRG
jgi:hypothetical protein